MTAFANYFTQYATGVGNLADWTIQGGDVTTQITAGGPYGKTYAFSSRVSANSSFSWNPAGSANDMEGLALVTMPALTASQNADSLGVRGATGSQAYYTINLAVDAGGVKSFNLKKSIPASTNLGNIVKAWVAGENWWLRVRAVGTTISGKAWKYGTLEPTAFDVSVTDSSLTTGNASVRFNGGVAPSPSYCYCAWGTNGDAAPLPLQSWTPRRQYLRR